MENSIGLQYGIFLPMSKRETGRIVKENDAQALLHDEAIKKAYLGE